MKIIQKIKFEYKITVIYLCVGCLWIIFSDKILFYFVRDNFLLTKFQTYKGWFYVIVTSLLFYIILKEHLAKIRFAEQRAKENDRLKSAFLQNISHEIRTPMNGIVGFAGLLNSPDLSEAQKTQYLETITKSSHQLLKIVNEILDISLIETGNIIVHETRINLNSFLEDIYHSFIPILKNDVKFSFQTGLPNNESYILTDEVKVRQVLTNILNNAFKFTEQGFINYGYSLNNSTIEFFVEDTGIGINEIFHDKIFDRFLKAELENSKLYDGVGLGLAICKGNVDLLKGRIWLRSQINKGSVFYFTIPYKRAEDQENNVKVVKASRKNTRKLRILVVEDEETNYMYIKQILEGTDSTIYHALNGRDAIDICKKDEEISLVLMDIKMPVMNGYEATKIIKELRPGLPVIAQTAFASRAEKEMALQSGFNEYISKPFKMEQIIKIIDDILE